MDKNKLLAEQFEKYSSWQSCIKRENEAFKDGWLARDAVKVAWWQSFFLVVAGAFVGFMLAAAAWAFVSAYFGV